MFDSQFFGILGPFQLSKLLYGTICTDDIYNDPYGPYNQTQNRADGKEELKKAKNCGTGCDRNGKVQIKSKV